MSRCHFCEIFLPRTFVRSVTEVRNCEDYSYILQILYLRVGRYTKFYNPWRAAMLVRQ